MVTLAALLAVPLLAVMASADRPTELENFDYNSQIGIAEVREGCLTIANPSLRENQTIKLVIPGDPQKVVEKRIGKRLKASCSRNPVISPNASFYALPVEADVFDDAIAIVGFAGDFKIVQGNVRADLNGDGMAESFRACTSNEGIHFTVWAGEALKTMRLWHQYYYLGYDIAPSCKPADGQ